MANDDTTLLLRLPIDLKGSFQGLCNARGVSVSEELRRFMADEVASAAIGMTTNDRPKNKTVPKKIPVVKASRKRSSAPVTNKPTKCDMTQDMFADKSNETSKKGLIDAMYENRVGRARKTPKNVTEGKLKLSEGLMDGIIARDKRKKSKK